MDELLAAVIEALDAAEADLGRTLTPEEEDVLLDELLGEDEEEEGMTKNQLTSWLNLGEDLGVEPSLLQHLAINAKIDNAHQPRHPKDGQYQGKADTAAAKGFSDLSADQEPKPIGKEDEEIGQGDRPPKKKGPDPVGAAKPDPVPALPSTNGDVLMPKVTNKAEALAVLTANCTCEATKASYNSLGEADAILLANAKNPEKTETPTNNAFPPPKEKAATEDKMCPKCKKPYSECSCKEAPAGNAVPQKRSMQELLANATDEDREVWNTVVNAAQERKIEYANKLVDPSITGEARTAVINVYVQKNSLADLKRMADAAPKLQQQRPAPRQQPQPSYVGNSGGTPVPTPTGNAQDDDTLDVLTMNELLDEERAAAKAG